MSEYRRKFVVPQSITDPTLSPEAGGHEEVGPQPQQDNVISAGLSSAKMAVTIEPAFTRKRKPLYHKKRVTFTTDYTAEHDSPVSEADHMTCMYMYVCVHTHVHVHNASYKLPTSQRQCYFP